MCTCDCQRTTCGSCWYSVLLIIGFTVTVLCDVLSRIMSPPTASGTVRVPILTKGKWKQITSHWLYFVSTFFCSTPLGLVGSSCQLPSFPEEEMKARHMSLRLSDQSDLYMWPEKFSVVRGVQSGGYLANTSG